MHGLVLFSSFLFFFSLVLPCGEIDDLRKSKGLHSVSAYGHGPVYIYIGPHLRV